MTTTRQSIYLKSFLYIFGVSLSEPHIDHDNGPRTQNNGM